MPDFSANRRYFAAAAAIFLVLLISSFQSYDIYVALRGIFQFVFYSTSPLKVNGYLVFTAILFALLAIDRPSLSVIKPSRLLWIIWIAFAFNLVAHCYYSQLVGVQLTKASIAVHSGNSFSMNSLIHTHVLKGVIGAGVKALGLEERIGFADLGLAFAEILPQWMLICGGFLLAILLAVVTQFARFVVHTSETQLFGKLLVFSIAAYSIPLRFIDGGMFASELPAAIALFSTLASVRRELTGFNFIFEHIKLSLILIGAVEIVLLCAAGPTDTYWLGALGALSFYAFLEVLVLALPNRNERKMSAGVLLFLLPQLIWFHSRGNLGFLEFLLNRPISKALLANPGAFESPLPVKFQEGDLKIIEILPKNAVVLREFFQDYNIRSAINLIGVNGINCSDQEIIEVSLGVKTVVPQPIPIDKSSPLLIRSEIKECSDKRRCDFMIHATIQPCVPNHDNAVVINHLAALGLRDFIVTGVRPDLQPD